MPTLSSHYQRRIERFVRIQRRAKLHAIAVLLSVCVFFYYLA